MSKSGSLVPLTWYRDPRVLVMSDSAQALVVRLTTWSADLLTDGVVPKQVMAQQTAHLSAKEYKAVIDELVRHGFVAHQMDDFLLVEWRICNLPKAEVEARIAERAEVARAGGLARAATAKRDPDGTFATSRPPSDSTSVPAGSDGGDSDHRVQRPVQRSDQRSPSPVPVPVPVENVPRESEQGNDTRGDGGATDADTGPRALWTADDDDALDAKVHRATLFGDEHGSGHRGHDGVATPPRRPS